MINKQNETQTRDILTKKLDADRLVNKIKKGLKIFLESPFVDKKN